MRLVARLDADKEAFGVLLVVASTIAFAIGPTAAKLALENGSNTLTIVTLRGVIGAVLMALVILTTRQSFRLDRRALKWCLYCSVFYALTIYGVIGSVAYIPVSIAVLIFFTHPVLLAVAAHRRNGSRVSARGLLFAFAALAGLAMVLGPDVGSLDRVGIALATVAAISTCGMILCSARALERATSAQVNCFVMTVTSAAFALLTIALGAWAPPSNTTGWLGIVGAGVGIGVGLLAFFAALRHLSPVRAAMLSNIEPLVSIVFAAIILGERLGFLQWVGAALVITALVLFESANWKKFGDG